jgi:hypothetical protein
MKASYEYINRTANKGAEFVSMRIPIATDCWKIWPPKTNNILSMRNSRKKIFDYKS